MVDTDTQPEAWTPTLERRGRSRQLIVIIHGLGSGMYVSDLKQAVESEAAWADADILTCHYNSGPLSPKDPIWLAEHLETNINDADADERVHQQPYEQIVLVGHSIGGLLVRSAYLIGQGKSIRNEGDPPAQHTWVERPARFVLLASINRGWAMPDRRRTGSLWRPLLLRALEKLAGLRGARFLPDCARDSVYVVNIRNHWIDLIRDGKDPDVVQLQGDEDDFISGEDCIDLQGGRKFLWRQVHNTRHFNISLFSRETEQRIRDRAKERGRNQGVLEAVVRWALTVFLSEKTSSAQTYADRRARFLWALSVRRDQFERYNAYNEPPSDLSVQRVVMLVHGIRTEGKWMREMGSLLESEAKPLDNAHPVLNLRTREVRYGFFPILRFLIPWTRRQMVHKFVRRYTDARAMFPRASFDVVAHSYGTYLVCQALKTYRSIRFENVVLAGSIVATDYDWSERENHQQVKRIRNYQADWDLVVASYPAAYQKLMGNRLGEFIGSAGVNGFQDPSVDNVMLQGCHSVAVSEDTNRRLITRFLLDREEPVTEDVRLDSKPRSNTAQIVANWSEVIVPLAVFGLVAGISRLRRHRGKAALGALGGLLAVLACV
jgi:pimeloyl-ACP methyl ester carboxylesterase